MSAIVQRELALDQQVEEGRMPGRDTVQVVIDDQAAQHRMHRSVDISAATARCASSVPRPSPASSASGAMRHGGSWFERGECTRLATRSSPASADTQERARARQAAIHSAASSVVLP
jgi:hypothetical protein